MSICIHIIKVKSIDQFLYKIKEVTLVGGRRRREGEDRRRKERVNGGRRRKIEGKREEEIESQSEIEFFFCYKLTF